jgi:L-serine dehydratase
VEIRYVNDKLTQFVTGQSRLYLRGTDVVSHEDLTSGEKLAAIEPLETESGMLAPVRLPFDTFEELVDYARREQKGMLELVVDGEATARHMPPSELFVQMAPLWHAMRDAVRQGLDDTTASPLGLSGGDAAKLAGFVGTRPLFDNLTGRAVAYPTAASEVNAKGGVVVACPTAGSCGLLPGLLVAYDELCEPGEQRLLEALLVAGFMGMILFDDVTTAGADYGCQAEVGAGAGMAAAALAYLEGGQVDTIVAAFTLAIKNCMGLVCDPVGGLVEVPCVKRNGIFASVAVSAAAMALAGLRSFVSPDEVVLAVREVGERLNRDYKETAGGGLARTRDGKRVERQLAEEARRFFGGSRGRR